MKEFCLNNNNDPILIIKDYVIAVRYNEKVVQLYTWLVIISL